MENFFTPDFYSAYDTGADPTATDIASSGVTTDTSPSGTSGFGSALGSIFGGLGSLVGTIAPIAGSYFSAQTAADKLKQQQQQQQTLLGRLTGTNGTGANYTLLALGGIVLLVVAFIFLRRK
ncbi:MAG: hypothetical protein WCJ07_05690 [Verrucomicrobiota bacterium]